MGIYIHLGIRNEQGNSTYLASAETLCFLRELRDHPAVHPLCNSEDGIIYNMDPDMGPQELSRHETRLRGIARSMREVAEIDPLMCEHTPEQEMVLARSNWFDALADMVRDVRILRDAGVNAIIYGA